MVSRFEFASRTARPETTVSADPLSYHRAEQRQRRRHLQRREQLRQG